MSVSARTFQLLYIIRQRALQDQVTHQQDFGEFIADRRKTAPALYGNAYISPSALQDLLGRMTVEGLVTNDSGEYQLEHLGSQMADLLDGLDACTTSFIEGYKEAVVLAALQQRARLWNGPMTQRDLAAVTNLSIDSVRRGLETLVSQGTVNETIAGRSQVYTLVTPPLSASPAPAITDTQDVNVAEVRASVAAANEPMTSADIPVTALDPDLKEALDHIDDDPVPLSAVLGDNGPDVEPPAATVTQEQPEPVPEEPYLPPPGCGQGCCDDCDENIYEEDGGLLSEEDWNVVPQDLRDALAIQAEASGLGLVEYLVAIVEVNQRHFRRALNGVDEQVIRTQMSEILNLQRQVARLQSQVQRTAKHPQQG